MTRESVACGACMRPVHAPVPVLDGARWCSKLVPFHEGPTHHHSGLVSRKLAWCIRYVRMMNITNATCCAAVRLIRIPIHALCRLPCWAVRAAVRYRVASCRNKMVWFTRL